MTEIPSVRIGAQAGENVRKNFFLNYKSDSETPIAIFNKPSSGRGGPLTKSFLNIKRFGPRIQPNLAQVFDQTGLFTADGRYVGVGRRSGLEEAEQFEDDYDDYNHSNYVQDISAHAGDSYQIERAVVNIYLNLSRHFIAAKIRLTNRRS